jgi:hypothetical protein
MLTALVLAAGCSSRSSAPSSGGNGPSDENREAAVNEVEDAAAGAMPDPEPAGDKRRASPKKSEPSLDDQTASPMAGENEAEEQAISRSKLELAEPMISGGLDRDLIRRRALDHEADILACHAKALDGNPELFGTLAIELKVDARGVVKDVELGQASELGERELVDCVLELASAWSFVGEATGEATVELGFELSAPE